MFTTQTTFVIGAGVNVPFRFPTGDGLLDILTGTVLGTKEYVEEVRQTHNFVIDVLKEVSLQPTFVDEFISELRQSGTSSIDNWLVRHSKFQPLGKLAIAIVIANAESLMRAHYRTPDDWYAWLFDRLTRGVNIVDRLAENRISFITFNYDRALEWRLEQNILSFYGDSAKARKAVEVMHANIFHVHGKLGEEAIFGDWSESFGCIQLPALSQLPSLGARRAKSKEFADWASHLATSIKIIGSEPLDPPLAYEITSRLDGADKIVFLGFSYDERNMAILNIKNRASKVSMGAYNNRLDYPIVGSAFGLRNAQRQDAEAEFMGKIYLGESNLTCVPFCNEYVSIKRKPVASTVSPT